MSVSYRLALLASIAVAQATWSIIGVPLAKAQEAAAETADDPVTKQATALEAELGKYKVASLEAADAMVKLADLYHQHGRVLGLIRVAHTFSSAHPTDKRHEAVMLKLMDGLEAMSRNNDLVIACRQFLERYPKSAKTAEVELRLARTLLETKDRESAAAAQWQVWRRHGPNPVGRAHGLRAVNIYLDELRGKFTAQGAAAAEEMLDRSPAGDTAATIGRRAFDAWRTAGQLAKSNLVGNKLLQKNLLKTPEERRQVHLLMGENHTGLGQHRNAFGDFQKARSHRDAADAHFRQILSLHNAQAAPNEMEALVNDYVRKYAAETNRYHGKSYLAQAYLRAKNNARALGLYRELAVVDPGFNSNAQNFVSYVGAEPANHADAEKHLKQAVGQQKEAGRAAYLRYVLAFNVYRDRLKNEAQTRQTLRELITKSPEESGYTTGAISWLLSSAADDNAFNAEADLIIRARRANLHISRLRNYPGEWAQANRNNKDLRKRAQALKTKLAAANKDPVLSLFLQHTGGNRNRAAQARGELIKSHFNNLPEPAARQVAYAQAYYYRHYGPAKQRSETASVWTRLLQRFPKDKAATRSLFVAATDYSVPEVRKEAALKFLQLPPESYSADLARRLFGVADGAKDAALARQAWQWVKTAQSRPGQPLLDSNYASYMGDILLKYKLPNEAKQLWKETMERNRDHYESRECAWRLLNQIEDENGKRAFLEQQLKHRSPFHGRYASWLADLHLQAERYDDFQRTLQATVKTHSDSPLLGWDFDTSLAANWLNKFRQDAMAEAAVRTRVYQAVKGLDAMPISSVADLLLLELEKPDARTPMARLLVYQRATQSVGEQYWGWDPLAPFAQSALARKDFVASATLATGMLANINSVDAGRKDAMRRIVSASYARMGAVGLTIDENSPLAPLLQAALYLRLGDRRLALEMYQENKGLFDEHRNELPVDLIEFICEALSGAGGDENFEYVEDVLRTWLVKNSESMQVGDEEKARVQLLLGKNYFRARRFDIARSEYTTVINRYPESAEALEAEFGVGETFMEQKVFDQAEQVFDKLARHTDTRTIVRADFLRGVLAFRRGDRDEAREIFRTVLERVPDVELANQTLFNLAEVFRVEERYIDQLNLLRTIGRLGQRSKRSHNPGSPLSIVVHDSDLGISRGHNKIPVIVRTEPGGDRELIYLSGAGAGKGLFRFDLETALGEASPNDKVLQVVGGDRILCDYPDEFKAEFRNVPLSDVEIRMAASADFKVASSRIEDELEKSFSEQLESETNEAPGDQRVSQIRPDNQIKPGNPVYLRIKDADRDVSQNPDDVVVKLVADSGDEVQVQARETGAHTGIFEASVKTDELPAGALATDSAIDHNPLMAIDKSAETFWASEPDGAAPKSLTVDMKDLYKVSRARVSTPDAEKGAPVRGELQGSYDGEFWFRLAAFPGVVTAQPAADEYGKMTQRVFAGNYTSYSSWQQIVNLARNTKPTAESTPESLEWKAADDADEDDAQAARAVIWFGKIVQPEPGAVRLQVRGQKTALAIDGVLELAPGPANRTVDVWLDKGVHELTAFAARNTGNAPLQVVRARANLDSEQVTLADFRAEDLDLERLEAQAAPPLTALQAPEVAISIDDAKFDKKTEMFGVTGEAEKKAIGNWQDVEDVASWEFDVTRPGVFEVVIDYAHSGNGGSFNVEMGSQLLTGGIANTGAWDRYQQMVVGSVLVEAPGKQLLSIRPIEIANGSLMNLRSLALRPRTAATVINLGNEREFRFPAKDLRYIRILAREYLGEAIAINHIEVGDAASGREYIPTESDILALADNDVLEIAAGDTVTATYTDDFTQTLSGSSQLLTRELTATYNNGSIAPIAYDYIINDNGVTSTARKDLLRVDPGEEVIVEIVDYDRDTSSERDKVDVEVSINDEEPIKLTAIETEPYSGVFTRKVFTSAEKQEVNGPEDDITLKVAQSDRIHIHYVDEQNTFPGHAVPRRSTVFVNEPTDGQVRVLASRVTLPPMGSTGNPSVSFVQPPEDAPAGVAFEAPLTVEVFDPDAAKDSRSTVTVHLKTSDGAEIAVECVVSTNYWEDAPADIDNAALHAGRFVGQIILQLGGKDSPDIIPLSPDMPRGLIGRARAPRKPVPAGQDPEAEDDDEEDSSLASNLIVRVLNLTGQDVVDATYEDVRRPDGKTESLVSQARLISQGVLQVTDREYEKAIEQLHVGEKLFLLVTDPDRDLSAERDQLTIEVTTENGEKESLELAETTVHSGVFTGSYLLKAVEKPTPDNAEGAEPIIESYFGDIVRVTYLDPATPAATDEPPVIELPVVVGTNGLVSAFTKTFNDETLAVETKFRIAESYFELFKSHKDLGRDNDKTTDLESGKRVLREVMEDYPDPKYAPRIAYLLGQFAQELEEWEEAIRSYEMIIQQHPDHTLAPDAQYKLAQCYEESGDFDEALEAYVTLAATHPKSPLIASVMIRISDYFYKNENFVVAAQVGEKFLERFEGNEHAAKIAFRVGQCYYKDKLFNDAAGSFDRFAKLFPEDVLGADAMFWSGESFRLANNNREAFRRYNRCRWDFPASEAAKYARGRLALPEMLQQFEAEANSIDQDN
ncbi:MAG: tetratricopeptide repeat protein [Pirellulaceae bacterium]|jgi:TolA-binding protein|nr:tetratricopeptide repeat protein [Pirellulaceae bacterium]